MERAAPEVKRIPDPLPTSRSGASVPAYNPAELTGTLRGRPLQRTIAGKWTLPPGNLAGAPRRTAS